MSSIIDPETTCFQASGTLECVECGAPACTGHNLNGTASQHKVITPCAVAFHQRLTEKKWKCNKVFVAYQGDLTV